MEEIKEILDRVIERSHEHSEKVEDTKSPSPDSDLISDPDDPETQISVEGFLYRQGWHRNQSMAGKTFDNFKVDTEDQGSRLSASRKYAEGKTRHKTMLMYGAPGRGKSHLARGIAAHRAINGGRSVYWPLMQLIGKLKAAMDNPYSSPDSEVDWLCRYKGLLIIDEIGRSKGGSWDRDNVIYPLLDQRQNLPTVWISNWTPEELVSTYDEAIVSRLTAGHSMPFNKSLQDMRQGG